MTKQHLIIGLLAAAAVGIGAFLYFAPVSREIGKPDPEPAIETSGKKIPFADFMRQGGAYACTVRQNVNNTDTSGSVRIDSGRLAGEFEVKVEGMDMEMKAYFIVRDGYSYSWSSMAPNMGFKVKTVAVNGEGNAEARAQLAFNAQSIGDYDCQPWTVDESVFAVPTSVQFREM